MMAKDIYKILGTIADPLIFFPDITAGIMILIAIVIAGPFLILFFWLEMSFGLSISFYLVYLVFLVLLTILILWASGKWLKRKRMLFEIEHREEMEMAETYMQNGRYFDAAKIYIGLDMYKEAADTIRKSE